MTAHPTRTRSSAAFVLLLGLASLGSPSRANHVLADQPAPPTAPGPAIEPAPQRFADPTNAALLYARAWLLIPEDTFKAVADANPDRNPDWVPDEALAKKLIDARGGIATMLRAAKLKDADFGLEYSQGIGAMMPHLAKMRGSARIVAADARRLHAAGDTPAAVERLISLFALSRHAAGDGVLISSLVSAAIHGLAVTNTERLLASASLTIEQRDAILSEMRRTNQKDPFGVHFAVLGERQWTEGWIRSNFSDDDGARKLIANLGGMLPDNVDPQTAQHTKVIAAYNQAQLKADLDRLVRFYDQAHQRIAEPDAVQRLSDLEAQAKAGEFGMLARVFGPALSKSKASEVKAAAERTALMDKLAAYTPGKK